MEVINVNLDPRSYPVYIGGELKDIGEAARQFFIGGKLLIISNERIFSLYGEMVRDSLEESGFDVYLAKIPEGERYKCLSRASKLYNQCLEFKLDRGSTILALGGGVIGDLAGFVASTFLRGINFVIVPTTLLAQVDASVGGKAAVNLPQGKNLIGSFYQPKFVYIDLSVLKTLPSREIRGGLAEVVKYGMISDKKLFSYLEKNVEEIKALSNEVFRFIVSQSVKIKTTIVEQDEREEKGKRRVLNFGHTIGHAIEAATKYRRYKHGEAVAIGMVAAASIAVKMDFFPMKSFIRLRNLLKKLNLPTLLTEEVNMEELCNALYLDKKMRDGKLHFVLPEDIGSVFLTEKVPSSLVKKVLQELGE
ncbi:MAG: 3-dehydroquinate synthase [Candidatus Aerophobetes bacterium]|nr:3-dehydroquinate synthase [Candidatus Aerophobetes bacterium]